MNWLVACFEPFAGAATNASALVAARLRSRDWAGRVEFTAPLPVSFGDAWPTLRAELGRRPHVGGVLTLGQAAGRRQVDLECLALNFVDTSTADNAGRVPPRGPWRVGQPEVRWTGARWAELPPAIAAARSYSAGTFVCNALFYDSLAWAAESGRAAAFVHVPALNSQAGFAHLPRLDDDAVAATVAQTLEFLVGT